MGQKVIDYTWGINLVIDDFRIAIYDLLYLRHKLFHLLFTIDYLLFIIFSGLIMRNILLITLCIVVLSSCGTLRISKADRKLVSEGKKSLLVTRNRDFLDYFYVIPILIDALGGEPVEVDIESIDGEKVREWLAANEEVAVEPGTHEIVATCTQKFDDINRDIDDKENLPTRSCTQTISYTFEGGKRYKIYAVEYLTHCEIRIGPY